MKRTLLLLITAMACVSAYAASYETYVDDARGFSVAHPSTWPRSIRGESVCFESPEGTTVSMRIQPLPIEDNNYTSFYQIPGAVNEMLNGVKALPGSSIISSDKTKLSGGDAYWVSYRMLYESIDKIVYIFTYQVVTLTPKGLLYCTYMAAGTTEQEAQALYNRVWDEALNMMRTLIVHQL